MISFFGGLIFLLTEQDRTVDEVFRQRAESGRHRAPFCLVRTRNQVHVHRKAASDARKRDEQVASDERHGMQHPQIEHAYPRKLTRLHGPLADDDDVHQRPQNAGHLVKQCSCKNALLQSVFLFELQHRLVTQIMLSLTTENVYL